MTEESSSIHAHETKKLGKLAPINRRSINAANFFQIAGVPDHPTTSVAPALGYPMDRNNEAGDCVVAGLDHALQDQLAGQQALAVLPDPEPQLPWLERRRG
jgi:hypothetical protein